MINENSDTMLQNSENYMLSNEENSMQEFLENAYGLTYDEFISIARWLNNFSLKLDNIERFEDIEYSLTRDFNLTANDIFQILFSHGDIFCADYSECQANYQSMNNVYGVSKQDFAYMLKNGCVINKSQVETIAEGLKLAYPTNKELPIKNILCNTTEQVNFDYVQDIVYKIKVMQNFDISFSEIGERFGFLTIPATELITRLELMCLTNELPNSFLNVGYKASCTKLFKTYLNKQADSALRKKGDNSNYVRLKKKASDFDDSKPLSSKTIEEIDEVFAEKFKYIYRKLLELQASLTETENATSGQDIVPVEPVQPVQEELISYVKQVETPVKASDSKSSISGGYQFVKIAPEHKKVWTFMVENFNLTYPEYNQTIQMLRWDKQNRLTQQIQNIEEVYRDISRDFNISKRDFGQFFKFTLYGMEQRLALLEYFGISAKELTTNNYENASILGLQYSDIEFMLKVAALGKVKLEKNLGRVSMYNKDTLLAMYIHFYETGEGETMFDTPMTAKDYQETIAHKNPKYKSSKFIDKMYAEQFPISNEFLQGYNQTQRNLYMVVGLLIKKYNLSYSQAKELVNSSSENFNEHSKHLDAKLTLLKEIGFDPIMVLQNSGILKFCKEEILQRAVLSKTIKVDDEVFLRRYFATSEARVYARMMGALDIKPSYYYAGEKIFNHATGLSTDQLMEQFTITPKAITILKHKILQVEKSGQTSEGSSVQPQSAIFDDGKLNSFTLDEHELKNYMRSAYGIDSQSTFLKKRNYLGSQNLKFLSVIEIKKIINTLKNDFDFTDEDITNLFIRNPKMFSNIAHQHISKYKYFQDNFDVSKRAYKKLLLNGDNVFIQRNDLLEQYNNLYAKMLKDHNIEVTKEDFILMQKVMAKHNNINLNFSGFVPHAVTILKSFNIEPTTINKRYGFLSEIKVRDLQTRLMLMYLIDESPEDYLNTGYHFHAVLIAERYKLYKQGKIAKEDLLLSNRYFEQKTGIKIENFETLPTMTRIEIVKDFVQKMKNVTFAYSLNYFSEKLQKKKDDEIIVSNDSYLRYMLTEILGVEFDKSNINGYLKVNGIYARFMERADFQDNPEQYFLHENQWEDLTNTKTGDLVQKYCMTDEVIETIMRYYFMLHPEDAYGKFLNVKNSEEQQETSEELSIQKIT